MPYNLQGFKSWLNRPRNQTLKQTPSTGFPSWESLITTWENSGSWNQVVTKIKNRPPSNQVGSTVLKWVQEVDHRAVNQPILEQYGQNLENLTSILHLQFYFLEYFLSGAGVDASPAQQDRSELKAEFLKAQANLENLSLSDDCPLINKEIRSAQDYLYKLVTEYSLPALEANKKQSYLVGVDHTEKGQARLWRDYALDFLTRARQEVLKVLTEQITFLVSQGQDQTEDKEQIEQELKSLSELKTRLESNWQQREGELTEELNQLRQAQGELATQLHEQATTLTNLREQLDFWKGESVKKEQEKEVLKTQCEQKSANNQELEQKLTTLAVSSGLLSQQVEQLTKQLSESEQKEERTRLEKEIQTNLVREQGEKINQQEGQIKNYQQLLRKSEENLKKGQELINQKSEQLEKLEREKTLIAEELELANGKIKELEGALLSSQSKISQLERRIKELESQSDNSEELERLKKVLAIEKQKNQSEKIKSQLEIKRLQSELAATKLREEELATKIKELKQKPVKAQESQEVKSFWTTIKTPLFYLGGGIIILIALAWIWDKLSD